jgi:hypothetical protein
MLRLSEEGKIVFSGQVIPPGEPLKRLPEKPVWSNHMSIHRIAKNGTVDYAVEFTDPPKDAFDELVRERLIEAVAKLPR